MEKKKFNLIGGPFQHAKTSTLYKESRYLEWDFQSKVNDVTFYVDQQILDGLRDIDDGRTKYAWLLESRAIFPHLADLVIQNKALFLDTYEAIFTHNQRLLELDEKFKWSPAYGTYIEDPKIHDKTKLVSMITSNKMMTRNHVLRNKLANHWKNSLDLYGRGYNEIDKKEEGLADYMFSIAIENDCYATYFTEKILDCFAMGTIPVYLGSPDIGKFFNKEGIIFLSEGFAIEDLNSDLYKSRIHAVQDNFLRVQQYDTVEDWIYENYFK